MPVERTGLLTAKLLMLLPALALALRLAGLRRVYGTLKQLSRGAAPTESASTEAESTSTEAERVAAAVVHVNRRVLPYQSRCLLESLAIWWLLRRRGIAADLVLGVRTIMGPFEAHAWVEHKGRPLNDIPSVRSVYESFVLDPTP